ncbi:antitoxin Xre/MbcA/ParS toxin-binding domain-containing protein [Shinella yambaruensis]|uniref:antitoxin Xre/MbcA/ParS toxin-binding domain-containing protein n=1 Tax=Shinella yambaruensis TaxID=415996 RepID=UPI003D78D900
MDVDVLEIDVSGYRAYPLDGLDEVIIDIAPREVLQSAAIAARLAKLADEKVRREEARLVEGRRKAAVYKDKDMGASQRAAELADWMIEIGLSEFMDLDDIQPSAFLVPRRQWQAAILYRLMDTKYPAMVGAVQMLDRLRERNWPKPAINAMTNEDTTWIIANVDPEFKSAYEEVLAYLRRLHAADLAHEARGNRFYMTQATLKRIADVIIHIERPEKRQEQAEAVLQAIRDLMIPDDGDWIEFDSWIENRASHYGTSTVALLQDEDSQFDELMDTLGTIRTAITRMQAFRQDEPPEDFAGLPLAGLFLRLQAERTEARDRAERERNDRLKREADARVSEITVAAGREFGTPTAWLATPLPDQGGRTPSELAADSAEGLRKAQVAISQVREDREAKERAEERRKANVRRLEDEAYRRISRQDVAKLWLNSSNKDLGGLKPVECCKDDKSLQRVMDVLNAFVDGEQKRRRR